MSLWQGPLKTVADLQQWVQRNYWTSEQAAKWAQRLFFRMSDFIAERTGAVSAHLPVRTNAEGYVDNSFIKESDIDHGSIGGLTDDDHPQYHNDARGDARYVNVTGDTMTGDLVVSDSSGTASIALSALAGQVRQLAFRTEALARWILFADTTAETGSNAGSNWVLRAYNDAGAARQDVLTITRSTGNITHTGTFTTEKLQAVFGNATEITGLKIENTTTAADELASILFELGSADIQAKIAAHLRSASAGSDLYFYTATSGGTLTHVATFTRDGHLTFGSAQDTNLYRNAANELKTDDSFTAGGRLMVIPNSSGNDAKAGGVLYLSGSSVGNVGAGEDTLLSYTLPAGTLASGNILVVEGVVDFNNNANAKSFGIKFDGSFVGTEISIAPNTGGQAWIRSRILVTSATAQRAITHANFTTSSNTGFGYSAHTATVANALTVALVGEGVSDNDVQSRWFQVSWEDTNA